MKLGKYREYTPKINFLRLPVNIYGFDKYGVSEFNSIVKYFEGRYKKWHDIARTPSGGISSKYRSQKLPAWDFVVKKAFIEMTVLTSDICARYQVSIHEKDIEKTGNKIGGSQAYRIFVGVCKKHNIDITKLAIENGSEVKDKIESPMIKCMNKRLLYREFNNVHHIDLNSSYMSGIAKAYPVLEPAISEIYTKRKEPGLNAEYKAVLNCSYGYFQSEYCRVGGHKFALSNLSLAARQFNDAYINSLIRKLDDGTRVVLMINTDGIWYMGHEYHDENEGTGLGQWKHDHMYCKFRMKSDGAYEFIENEKYTPVVRGSTRLDEILDRKDWKWGDIFKYDAAQINKYYFDRETLQILSMEELK